MERVACLLKLIANYVSGAITLEELLMGIRHHCDRMEKEAIADTGAEK